MSEHRPLTLLKGRVHRDPVKSSRHGAGEGGALDLGSQHEDCLAWRQFSGRDCFGTMPTREDGIVGLAQIVHPPHDAIRRGKIALALLL